MENFYCKICDVRFTRKNDYDNHMHLHNANEAIPVLADSQEFIPEVERDESGKIKPGVFRQRPYKPLSEYEGG